MSFNGIFLPMNNNYSTEIKINLLDQRTLIIYVLLCHFSIDYDQRRGGVCVLGMLLVIIIIEAENPGLIFCLNIWNLIDIDAEKA